VKRLLVLLLFVLPVFPQGTPSLYNDRAIGVNPLGQDLISMPFAQVRVCTAGASGSPCSPVASIADVNGNPLPIVGGNFGQLTADNQGRFNFECTPANYRIQIVQQSSNTPFTSYLVSCPGTGSSSGNPGGNSGEVQWNNTGTLAGITGSNVAGDNLFLPDQLTVTNFVASASFNGPAGSVLVLSSTAGATAPTTCPSANEATFTLAGDFATCKPVSLGGDGNFHTSSAAGAVLLAPITDQNVAQPSAGGTSTGTSLNANVFEQVRYADKFQWTQSPAGTISVGANTVTINAVRGISQYSAPPGVLIGGINYYADHKLWIAGTGTPEGVLLTATSCTGSTTGTCTVTFTAANSHGAGFTVGIATAGFEEANIDCAGQWQGLNPVSGCTIKGSPYNQKGKFVFNATYTMFNLTASGGSIDLDCEQALLEDNVSGGPMILYGPMHGTGNSAPEHGTIRDCGFGLTTTIGRAANGTQILIRDLGQNLAVRNSNFNGSPSSGSNYWDTIIQVSADQGFILDHNDFAAGFVGKCDSTWCGPAIWGDGTSSAAIGVISNNNFTNVSGFSTAVLWESGNGLSVRDNVFQNWVKYPWKYKGGLLSIASQGGNYYETGGGPVNPDFGVGSFASNTGPQVANSGTTSSYTPGQERNNINTAHRFSSTGANIYSYYVVGNLSGKSSRPLFIGDAASDSSTPIVLLWLKFGATTYDILRTGPAAGDGTDAAPWGTNAQAVATGLTCTVNPCTTTDSFAALSSYQVLAEFQSLCYAPNIDYWPVPLFIHGSSTSPTTYIGPIINGFVNSSCPSTSVGFYDGTFTSELGGAGYLTGMHILHQMPIGASGSAGNKSPGAMILSGTEIRRQP